MAPDLADTLAWYDGLRERDPTMWSEEHAAWFVTRYDLVARLLVDERLGARSPKTRLERLSASVRDDAAAFDAFLGTWPAFQDPSAHPRVRAAARRGLDATARRRAAAAAELTARAVAPSTDRIDLLRCLLEPVCGSAAAALLGVPAGDIAVLLGWSHDIMRCVALDAIDEHGAAVLRRGRRAIDQLSAYVASRDPATARSGVAQWDAIGVFAQLLTGMIEPTVVIAARTVEEVANDPARRSSWQRDPIGELNDAARVAAPFHVASRTARVDLSIGGRTVRAGQRVVLVLAAANRDARAFPRERAAGTAASPHLAFGRGTHVCPGRGLAQAVAAVIVRRAQELGLRRVESRYAATLTLHVVEELTGLR